MSGIPVSTCAPDGRPINIAHLHPPRRFIPAPAGNSRTISCWEVKGPVHPRACGEQKLQAASESPHQRFIPAPAGNSCKLVAGALANPVHPRACGEQISIRIQSSPIRGSSPRLRGTVRRHGAVFAGCRFIPAPAGNSSARQSHIRLCPVHPRACGEQQQRSLLNGSSPGSSPRLRGTERYSPDPPAGRRFIPAPAGNRNPVRYRPEGGAVHPRACGEQMPLAHHSPTLSGSSPRLRGTGCVRPGRIDLQRFIPAPAGNSSYR